MNSAKLLKITNWIYDLHWMANLLTLSLPEYLMEFLKVSLTFEYVDEIVWCDHSNERSLPILSHGAIFFIYFFLISQNENLEIWSKFAFG